MRRTMLRTLLVSAFAILGSIASAQTLYGIDGSGPAPVLREYTGPPDPALCNYPNGPIVAAFPAVGSAFCPGLLPFPLPFDGDIAIDTVTDQVYAGDVFTIARYSSNGAVVDSFPSPLAITGMAIDPIAPGGPLLWITDGFTYGAIVPPPVPGCLFPPPAFAIGPFAVPPLSGPGVPITDLDWDPGTGTLIACDINGFVGSFLIGGPAGPPYGVFPVTGGPCPLNPPLTGIAFDNAVAGSGTFYVTDGFTIAYLIPGGGPAPPTFYTPFTCNTLTSPPISGLDYSSRPIRYGLGSDAAGGPPPRMGSLGHSIVPNPSFGFTLSGAAPGGTAALLYTTNGVSCPAIPFAGVNLLISSRLSSLPPVAVDAGGNAFRSVPLPPTVAVGLPVWVQWFVLTPSGSLQMSDASGVTTALP